MIVLDAYAVLAYLRDERAAEEVGELLRTPTVLTAVNASEVLDQLVQLAPVSAEMGLLAGRLRARHDDRQRMAVRAEEGRMHALPDSAGRLP